jgi:AcrR family transcriptional regulator
MLARRRLTRERVVQSAACWLDEHPGQVLSLADLASQLGVRTPSLYNHIDGLDDLHQTVAVLGVRELAGRIGKAAIGKAGDDAIEAIAWSYREFAKQRPGVYLMTQGAPRPEETELNEAAQHVLHILSVILEPYELAEEELVHTIRGMRTIVHGFVSLELAGGFGLPIDLDESFTRLVRMFIDQLNGRAAHGHGQKQVP